VIAGTPNFSPWRVLALIVPLASILVAILMMPLPIGIKVWGYTIMPSLPLLAIFLWTLYRPELLPPMAVLLFGLLFDLLINGPIGSSSIVFLAAYTITLSQRIYWKTLQGPGLLGGFIFVVLPAELLSWATASFSFGHLLSPTPALLEALASILLLPLARRAFVPLERMVGPGIG
jgi:rod shape-determining protein MreD